MGELELLGEYAERWSNGKNDAERPAETGRETKLKPLMQGMNGCAICMSVNTDSSGAVVSLLSRVLQ